MDSLKITSYQSEDSMSSIFFIFIKNKNLANTGRQKD